MGLPYSGFPDTWSLWILWCWGEVSSSFHRTQLKINAIVKSIPGSDLISIILLNFHRIFCIVWFSVCSLIGHINYFLKYLIEICILSWILLLIHIYPQFCYTCESSRTPLSFQWIRPEVFRVNNEYYRAVSLCTACSPW